MEFRIKPHDTRDVPIVEVYHRGVFVATIVPGDGDDLRVYSKFMDINAVNISTDPTMRTGDGRKVHMLSVPFELPPPGASRPGAN